ncbi:MAG: hypothetical protein RIS35_1888, partial [Pseudomonadota bacterium]
ALPNFAALMRSARYARMRNFGLYRTENSWLTLLQGNTAEQSGEWGHQDYRPGTYEAIERGAYEFQQCPPFHALGKGRRVAVFDLPLTALVEDLEGLQLLGWGTEVNQIVQQSSPPELLESMLSEYGPHPLYGSFVNTVDGTRTLSYRIPSVYDADGLMALRDCLVQAVRTRTRILLDLLARERWDLFVGVYAEAHTALHLLWHLSQPHPLRATMQGEIDGDPVLEVFRAIDAGLGEIIAAVAGDASLFVFSPHGMQANTLDLYSLAILPEFLYRWSTGRVALCDGGADQPLQPPRLDYRRHWREEVWATRTELGESVLESPFDQENRRDPLDWSPANWYRRCWPTMRAFALPGYSEGLVRVNVQGRDGPAGIPPERFGAACDELTDLLERLVDSRSGRPLVDRILRIRQSPMDDVAGQPPADLMVCWREDVVTDVAEHPEFGTFGPIPYFRTGGHSTEGFVFARGPSFGVGLRPEPISVPDLTAAVFRSLDMPVPAHVTGNPASLFGAPIT